MTWKKINNAETGEYMGVTYETTGVKGDPGYRGEDVGFWNHTHATPNAIHTVIPDRPSGDHQWNDEIEQWETDLADIRLNAHWEIDIAAGMKRRQFITDIPGQDMTYGKKAEQAQAYKDVGYPADTTDFKFVQARANAYGETPEVAADTILATRDAWIPIGAAIEEEREKGKKAVSDASDYDAIILAKDDAIAAINAI